MGRVLFSLTESREPVIEVITRLNGVIADRLTGDDLRKVGATYVQLPVLRGNYTVSVEARAANGCSDGESRPMTVTVK